MMNMGTTMFSTIYTPKTTELTQKKERKNVHSRLNIFMLVESISVRCKETKPLMSSGMLFRNPESCAYKTSAVITLYILDTRG